MILRYIFKLYQCSTFAALIFKSLLKMRNLFYIIFLLFLCESCSDSEPLPSNLNINTQSDVDMYEDQLRDTEVFDGNITIGNIDNPSPIIDLSAFNNIEDVTGEFILLGDICIESLSFESLSTVGGRLHVGLNCAEKLSFPNLTSVLDIVVVNCNNLKEIEFPSLCETTTLTNSVDISRNPSLEIIGSTGKLTSANNIQITVNPRLREFIGFENLEIVNGNFNFDLHHPVELKGEAFSKFREVNSLSIQGVVENGMDYSWTSNLEHAESLQFWGSIEIEELCPLRELVSENLEISFLLWDNTGNMRGREELESLCE